MRGVSGSGGRPASHYLHLYNAEHPCDITAAEQTCPPGALIGQLEGAN